MEANRFDALIRAVPAAGSRRALFGAFAGGAGLLNAAGADGKQRWKKNGKGKRLCRADGGFCKKKSTSCQARFCLKTPFTIEAVAQDDDLDHDTYLFVPNAAGSLGPSPFIDFGCSAEDTNDGALYPFAFMSRDVDGPDQITTIRRLLPGTYEFWIELATSSPAANVTVLLHNANDGVLRGWTSPANPSASVQRGWHVFDIDGATRRITSIDELIDDNLPGGAHDPVTDVCP